MYNEDPLTAKAKIITAGITYISDCSCKIKSCFIAGSKRYAIEEVLPANSNVKKTEITIFLKYFIV